MDEDWELIVYEFSGCLATGPFSKRHDLITPVGLGVSKDHPARFATSVDGEVDDFVFYCRNVLSYRYDLMLSSLSTTHRYLFCLIFF